MGALDHERVQDGLAQVFSELLLEQAGSAGLHAVYQGKREYCLHRVGVGLQELLLVQPRLEMHDLGLMLPRGLLSKVFH